MIGKTGIALTDLAPKGDVSVDGIIWEAQISNPAVSKIEKGTSVKILQVNGLVLEVEPEAIKQNVEL